MNYLNCHTVIRRWSHITPPGCSSCIIANITPPMSPVPPVAVATTPQVSRAGAAVTIVLEDTDWQGGYRRPGGQTYGGRTATWIYGSSTEYGIMRARFAIANTLVGTATLTIEGMDSEGRAKTPIQISVNGIEIFQEELNVVMSQKSELIALTGYVTSASTPAARPTGLVAPPAWKR